MGQCCGCVHTLRTSKKMQLNLQSYLVNNILYYKNRDLMIRREQFREEDRKEVVMCRWHKR